MLGFAARTSVNIHLKSELMEFVARNTPGLNEMESVSQIHVLEGKGFLKLANVCIVLISKELKITVSHAGPTYVSITKEIYPTELAVPGRPKC